MMAAVTAGLLSTASISQTLEETLLTLYRGGAVSNITKRESGILVVDDVEKMEVRVLDPAFCVVRITDLTWTPMTPVKREWSEEIVGSEPNLSSRFRDYYLNGVIADRIEKVAGHVLTEKGVPVPGQPNDTAWRLSGYKNERLMCIDFTSGQYCRDTIEFYRRSPEGAELPDEEQRIVRVDQAISHLYANLCKGIARRTPK